MAIAPPGSSREEPSLDRMPGFTVVGFSIRTTNQEELAGKEGKIGALWQRFLAGAGDTIPDPIEPHAIYSVYTNYESDERGAYDIVLGKAVHSGQQPLKGMTALAIPPATYRVFPVSESSPAAVRSAWENVYLHFEHNTQERRAFTSDLERHSSDGSAIYIAVR